MKFLNSLGFKQRFALLTVVIAIGFVLYGSFSLKIMNDLKIKGPLYDRIILGKDLIADFLPPPEYVIESYLVALQLIDAVDTSEQNQLIDRLKSLKAEYDTRHEFWLRQAGFDRDLLNKAHAPAQDFYHILFDSLIPALQKSDQATLDTAKSSIAAAFAIHKQGIDQIVESTNQYNQAIEKSASEQLQTGLIELIAILLSVLTISIVLSILISRNALKQLGIDPIYASGIAKEIAKGNFSRDIHLEPGDSSSLLYAMKVMQQSIQQFVAAQGQMAQKHADGWISEQIDVSKFRGTYATMAQEINILVRSHIDVKMEVVEVINRYAQGDFSVDMSRLPGDKGKITDAIDSVKQSLFGIVNEIKTLAEAGAQGDFSKRSDADHFSYLFKDILNDFNSLIATCDSGFKDILRVSDAMANGDMTQNIDKTYPGTFGAVIDGMNKTGENLKSLVTEIKVATNMINTAAKEIAAGNNDLSHRTEEQAASLEQTAASMEQLTSTVEHNAQNAKEVNLLAQGAAGIAAKGGLVVDQVIITMDAINESSGKIVDIISVIDGIAFQTNILALNAAVEAARAGEQGRGFAVVASEVRNLAHRAAAAAGEVKNLIRDSVEKVEGGSQLVSQAGVTMAEIVQSINQVTRIISNITSASTEQSSGIQQVNEAIRQMDDVTQQNAALVEQAAASAESLEEQAELLSANVAKFRIDDNFLVSSALQKTTTSMKGAQGAQNRANSQAKTALKNNPESQVIQSVLEWEEF